MLWPKVCKYFAAELEATASFFYKEGLRSFAKAVTGATIGFSLWNRAHLDDDLGLTILVALGAPSRGGEFAHPEVGRAHHIRHGTVLVVNPRQMHGTRTPRRKASTCRHPQRWRTADRVCIELVSCVLRDSSWQYSTPARGRNSKKSLMTTLGEEATFTMRFHGAPTQWTGCAWGG